MMRLSVDLWLNLPSRPCVPKPMSLLPLTHVGRGRKTVNGRGTQHITCVTPDARLRVVSSQTQCDQVIREDPAVRSSSRC